MQELGPQYLVDGVRLRPSDDRWQPALANAHKTGGQPLCLCRPGGVPMYVARYNEFVVKRLPDNGPAHHPACCSYEQPPGQSGLGEVLGDAVIECAPDRTEVRLDFPLTRRPGRPIAPGEPSAARTEVVAQRRRLGLRGLVHLLLQRAGFNRWYPRMHGKRTWYVLRKHLMAAAGEIETKGMRLADVLFIPEPYTIEAAVAIARRRAQALSVLLSPGEDVQFRLMVVMGELKEFCATDIDYRIVLRHMPDCPLYMERKAGERFKKVFEREYEAWAHQRAAEQGGHADPMRLRFLFCGLIYAKREAVYFIDTATLVMCSASWIPLDQPYEQPLIDELVRQERRFLKPLRFESKQGAAFPNAVLLDTGDAELPLDIVTPFMSERDRSTKERAIGKRPAGWVWNMQCEQAPPPLPERAEAARAFTFGRGKMA
ncbi:hypothetical protein BURC_03988 [Burkholderiaceae bacterium]|nr:hypothetical protein BURC_03988 [Burkholderiaceae bacterium]